MKIAIDLDEVITEFVKGYLTIYNQKYGKNLCFENIYCYDLWKPLEISKKEAIQLANEFYNSEYFENIGIVKDVRESILKISKNNKLFIITARPTILKNKTRNFLKENFPCVQFRIIHSGDFFSGQGRKKADICEMLKIPLIVEDHKDYALECAKKGIDVLLFDKPWNRDGEMHENIKRVYSWNQILNLLIQT